MIDISYAKTIRNGLSLNNKTGIFEIQGSPIGQDKGVPQSSLALDYTTPAFWYKQSQDNNDWIRLDNPPSLTPPVAPPTVTSFNGLFGDIYYEPSDSQALYMRRGTSETNSWLKLSGLVSSDKSGLVCPTTTDILSLSASCEYDSTGLIEVYVRELGVWSKGYGSIDFIHSRKKYKQNFKLTKSINVGDEIALKVDSGSFENLAVHLRVGV